MKSIVRIGVALGLLLVMPTAANAEEGYIRIGDRCYLNSSMLGGWPLLINVPCPNDLSENP